MFHGPSSKELNRRLRDGTSSEDRRAREHHGTDADYVKNVRTLIKRLPSSGSQHIRVANQEDNWLLSQYRWLVEQRTKTGTDWAELRAVLMGCVEQFDVMAALDAPELNITTDHVVEAATEEQLAGLHDDNATLVAIQHRTPGAWRQMADNARAQMRKLARKAHLGDLMASRRTA